MEDQKNTIGLTELLDEVSRDLDEFRKKHSGDYTVKNITMWWDLERERMLARHNPATVVRKLRKLHGFKRLLLWFFAGWATMLAVDTVVRLVIP